MRVQPINLDPFLNNANRLTKNVTPKPNSTKDKKYENRLRVGTTRSRKDGSS